MYLQRQGKVVRNKMYGSESSYEDIPNEIIKDYSWVVRGDLPPLIDFLRYASPFPQTKHQAYRI